MMLLNTKMTVPRNVLTMSRAMLIFFFDLYLLDAAFLNAMDRTRAITVIKITRICFIERMVPYVLVKLNKPDV